MLTSKYNKMRYRINRKAQITIFVILAIAIIGILIVVFLPKIKVVVSKPVPEVNLQKCMLEKLENSEKIILDQGGSLNPEHYFLYNNSKFQYLCYSNEYYKRCVMQVGFIEETVEKELIKNIEKDIDVCINEIKQEFNSRGYEVEVNGNQVLVDIVPKNIFITLNTTINIRKSGDERVIQNIKAEKPSSLSKILAISTSILNFEASLGDSNPEEYMSFYPSIKIEKKKQGDGTKLYIVSDRDTLERFQFAVRSLAWPPGRV